MVHASFRLGRRVQKLEYMTDAEFLRLQDTYKGLVKLRAKMVLAKVNIKKYTRIAEQCIKDDYKKTKWEKKVTEWIDKLRLYKAEYKYYGSGTPIRLDDRSEKYLADVMYGLDMPDTDGGMRCANIHEATNESLHSLADFEKLTDNQLVGWLRDNYPHHYKTYEDVMDGAIDESLT